MFKRAWTIVSATSVGLVVVLALATSNAVGDPGCVVQNGRTTAVFDALQPAVDAAAPGDVLNVEGTCHGETTIGTDVTIHGDEAALDGDGLGLVLGIYASVEIADVTITGGTLGGIQNFGRLTLTRSAVTHNRSPGSGGGIHNYGTVTLAHSSVSENTSDFVGGGILNGDSMFSAGTVILSHSTVTGNRSTGNGGGIYNTTGKLTVSHSLVTQNTGGGLGGGIFSRGPLEIIGSVINENEVVDGGYGAFGGGIFNAGLATITDSTVEFNRATSGGGLFNGGTARIATSTVSENTAAEHGGGIHNEGTLSLETSTVSRNAAGVSGGGVFNASGTVTLAGSVVSGNTPDDCVGLVCGARLHHVAIEFVTDWGGIVTHWEGDVATGTVMAMVNEGTIDWLAADAGYGDPTVTLNADLRSRHIARLLSGSLTATRGTTRIQFRSVIAPFALAADGTITTPFPIPATLYDGRNLIFGHVTLRFSA